MRVTLDMDPRDVWRFEETAERLGTTPGAVLRDELATRRSMADARERIRTMVVDEHMCDADIAAATHYTPGWVADIRRGMGLPANRRYPSRHPQKTERKSA